MPISDLYTQATTGTRPIPSTLTAIKGTGTASLTAAALTGWPTATACHFILYQVTTGGVKIAGTQTDWKGVVSGTTITNLTLKAGTDASYPIGTIVECAPTAAYANDLYAAATAEHTALGVHNLAAATTIAPLLPAGSVAPTALATAIPATKFTNPYKFRVYRTAALNSPAGGVAVIAMDTKNYDTSNNVDVVTNKGRFTVPINGFYQFSAAINIASGGALGGAIQLNKNGVVASLGVQMTPQSSTPVGVTVSDCLQLVAGDYIEPVVFTNASASVNTSSYYTYFSGFLVSTT